MFSVLHNLTNKNVCFILHNLTNKWHLSLNVYNINSDIKMIDLIFILTA